MTAQNLVWVEFFILVSIMMLVLVPRERIVQLLPFGLVAGFVVAFIIQVLAVSILQLWSFNHLSFISFRGIPIFVVLAWIPSTIIFAHLVISSNTTIILYILPFGFALISTIVEYLFVHFGYRTYLRWNVLATFLLALAIHSAMTFYLASRKVTV